MLHLLLRVDLNTCVIVLYALCKHACVYFSVSVNAFIICCFHRRLKLRGLAYYGLRNVKIVHGKMCYHCNTCLCLTHVTVFYSNFTNNTDLVWCLFDGNRSKT